MRKHIGKFPLEKPVQLIGSGQKKNNALILRVKFYDVTFFIYLNKLEQSSTIFPKLFHGFSKHVTLIRSAWVLPPCF